MYIKTLSESLNSWGTPTFLMPIVPVNIDPGVKFWSDLTCANHSKMFDWQVQAPPQWQCVFWGVQTPPQCVFWGVQAPQTHTATGVEFALLKNTLSLGWSLHLSIKHLEWFAHVKSDQNFTPGSILTGTIGVWKVGVPQLLCTFWWNT